MRSAEKVGNQGDLLRAEISRSDSESAGGRANQSEREREESAI